jgi:hypothetical protein
VHSNEFVIPVRQGHVLLRFELYGPVPNSYNSIVHGKEKYVLVGAVYLEAFDQWVEVGVMEISPFKTDLELQKIVVQLYEEYAELQRARP